MIVFKQEGPVNHTIVGSPTIVDGVASGLSISNYLKLSNNFTPGSYAWEIKFKVMTGNNVQNHYDFFGSSNDTDWKHIGIGTQNAHFKIYLSSTGSRWDIGISEGSYTISVNTSYYLKLIYNTASYQLFVSTDNENWTNDITIQNATPIYQNSAVQAIGANRVGSGNYYWPGSIDLNETYIKVNGQLWFGQRTTPVSRVRLQGPVECSVVGNPTIQNDIVSGFSSSDYVQENTSFDISTTNKVEIFTKVTTGQTVSMSNIIGYAPDSHFGIYLQENKPTAMYYYYNGTSNTVSQNNSSISLQPNTTYYLKATFDLLNHSSTIAVSTDNQNWSENTKVLTDFVSFPSYQISYQIGYSSSGAFQGSIDLNETYIRVNGKLWFGKEPVKKIVKDGVTVWEEV